MSIESRRTRREHQAVPLLLAIFATGVVVGAVACSSNNNEEARPPTPAPEPGASSSQPPMSPSGTSSGYVGRLRPFYGGGAGGHGGAPASAGGAGGGPSAPVGTGGAPPAADDGGIHLPALDGGYPDFDASLPDAGWPPFADAGYFDGWGPPDGWGPSDAGPPDGFGNFDAEFPDGFGDLDSGITLDGSFSFDATSFASDAGAPAPVIRIQPPQR